MKAILTIDLRKASDRNKATLNNELLIENAYRIEAGQRLKLTDHACKFWNDDSEIIGLEISKDWQVKTVRKALKLDKPKAGVFIHTVASFVETL